MKSSCRRVSIGVFATFTVLALSTSARAAEEPEQDGHEPAITEVAAPSDAATIAPSNTPADSAAPANAVGPEVEHQTIHVTTAMLSPRRNNSLSPRRFVPTLSDGTSLKGAKFYLAIGRPDLAQTYRRRQRIRWGLYGGGAGLVVAGMGVAIAGVVRKPQNKTMEIAGLAVASAGVLTMVSANVFAHFAPAHSIEPAVAKDLIDQHNAKLQTQAARGGSKQIRVGPQLTGTSAGVVVAGRF